MPDRPYGHRRSFWDDMSPKPDEHEGVVPGMPFHDHRPPRWIVRAIVGLTVLMALNLVASGISIWRDVVQQEYIEGRGEFRTAESERIEAESMERIREGICDLLDTLPEGGLLDRPRAKYGCGPGIPIEELTPEEQAQVGGRTTPQIAPPAEEEVSRDRPSLGTPAVPSPPRTPAQPVPAAPGSPQPEPADPGEPPAEEPDPILDLGVSDLLCDTLFICI